MRIKCIVSYDGSSYFGFQSQVDVLNIQDTIENALSIIHKEKIKIVASGRTDKGVHALGQVFHFDTNLNLLEEEWKRAINANLPFDIRILSVEKVSDSFHARFDVKKKEYDYYLNLGEYDLFQRNYISQINTSLDLEKMKEVSKIFIGTHDFTSLCSNSLEETPNQIRTIDTISLEQNNEILCIKFVGNGFLRYMVRMMVGLMIEAGKGKLSASDVVKTLDAKSKDTCRIKANSEGLYLVKVEY